MLQDLEDFMLKGFNNIAYPPFNIIKTSETNYLIELAVAGFDKENIKAYTEDKCLVVEGTRQLSTSNYIHKGISTKSFRRSFIINNDFKVDNISLNNGLLTISLSKIENNSAPKLIPIL